MTLDLHIIKVFSGEIVQNWWFNNVAALSTKARIRL